MDEVTFIIKTLDRPYCLNRLVKSIYRYYPDARILVGDDSEVSCKETIKKRYPDKKITVYELPHDCGISYGRNYLVKQVKTKYFVLLDDDFEFDRFTDIQIGLGILNEKELDIVGGYFREYPVIRSVLDYPIYFVKTVFGAVRKYNYIGYIEEKAGEVRVKYYTKRFPEYEEADLVHNFFIARTDVIREKCLWDEPIKVHEHTLFFIKAKRKGLKVGFTGEMSVRHKPIRFSKYNRYRERNYIKEWMKLYGFQRFVSITDDGEEKAITSDRGEEK